MKLTQNINTAYGLTIVAIYAIAGLVLCLGNDNLELYHESILIWFLVLFPNFVLAAVAWLVIRYQKNLIQTKQHYDFIKSQR